MTLDRPIFLIGAARSGTTIIGHTLAAHPDIALWDEPRYVWRHGNHGAKHDARPPEAADDQTAAFIRRQFEQFLRRSARKRFLEKTPSNCFRVRFMHRIFPDGLFLHVRRDGRDTAASAIRRWCSAPDDSAIARRMRGWEIPFNAIHHYLPDIMRELVLRRLRPNRGYLWGPRYPGIETDLQNGLEVAAICARQWAESEIAASEQLATLPPEQVFTFHYEDFVMDPRRVLSEILAFADLPVESAVLDRACAEVRSDRLGAFSQLPQAQRESIEKVYLAMAERLSPQTWRLSGA